MDSLSSHSDPINPADSRPAPKGPIDATETTYLLSGAWQFDVWNRYGHWRIELVSDHAETEETIEAWGRASWVDTKWLFWKVA